MRKHKSALRVLPLVLVLMLVVMGNDKCEPDPELPLTQYPIVLVHGFCGFKDIVGIEYFYGVEDHLVDLGYDVHTVELSAINSIETRAQQLKDQLILLNAEKVNLVAHSQGGVDARYMITHLDMADRVASLTTISTPHRGTSLADIALGLLPGAIEDMLDFLLNILGMDLEGAYQLTTEYMEQVFNPATPDDPSVYYQSYSAHAGPGTGNIMDPLFAITSVAIAVFQGSNDGIIPVESSIWTNHQGNLAADHMDQVGHLFGSTDSFDYLGFYEDVSSNLALRGF